MIRARINYRYRRIGSVAGNRGFDSQFHVSCGSAASVLEHELNLAIVIFELCRNQEYVSSQLRLADLLRMLQRLLTDVSRPRRFVGLLPQKLDRTSHGYGGRPTAQSTKPALYRTPVARAPGWAYKERQSDRDYGEKTKPRENIANYSENPHRATTPRGLSTTTPWLYVAKATKDGAVIALHIAAFFIWLALLDNPAIAQCTPVFNNPASSEVGHHSTV